MEFMLILYFCENIFFSGKVAWLIIFTMCIINNGIYNGLKSSFF